MRRVLHPFLALLLSLLLVGGQQAALAHMLGHVLVPATVQVVDANEADHGAALSLSHTCTTCIAFAGADLAPPAALAPPALAAGNTAALAIAVPPAPTLAFLAAFRSRAPPLL